MLLFKIQTFMPSFIRPIFSRDAKTLKSYFQLAIASLIAGIIISILDHDVILTIISLYSETSEFISYPVLQAVPVHDETFISKLLHLLKTNILVESLFLITLPGIFLLSRIPIILKFLTIGILLPPIALEFAGLTPFIVLVILLEIVASSMAGLSGDHLGLALLTPKRLYGNVGRIAAFKQALVELVKYYTVVTIILSLSSLIECTIAYALSVLFTA